MIKPLTPEQRNLIETFSRDELQESPIIQEYMISTPPVKTRQPRRHNAIIASYIDDGETNNIFKQYT